MSQVNTAQEINTAQERARMLNVQDVHEIARLVSRVVQAVWPDDVTGALPADVCNQLDADLSTFHSRVRGVVTAHKKREAGRIQSRMSVITAYAGVLNTTGSADTALTTAVAVGAALGFSADDVKKIVQENPTPVVRSASTHSTQDRTIKKYQITIDGTEIPTRGRSNGEIARLLARVGVPIGTSADDAKAAGIDASGLDVGGTLTVTVAGRTIVVKREE